MSIANLMRCVVSHIRKKPRLVELLKSAAHHVSPKTVAIFDYPVNAIQRWDPGNPHSLLYEIINTNRDAYRSCLESFLRLSEDFLLIPKRQRTNPSASEPCWVNTCTPALDAVALYSLLVTYRPGIYMEIGSGNSTKFARKAIVDHGLDTKMVSIDPCPRAEVDNICDEIVRRPVEEVDMRIFDRLAVNDILYVDDSHRVFMNSDATTIFLDVLPRLRSGVLVEIHDVTLPYDYPSAWADRYYAEQYLLAAYILAKGDMFDIMLPNTFIGHDPELRSVLAPLWERDEMAGVEAHGCSFWLRMK